MSVLSTFGAAPGAIYVSDQTNHCVRKAARIAGFPAAQVRTLPTTAELRIDVDAAAATIAADRAVGLHPFLLLATAGTTSAGVIDPLAESAALARRQEMWCYVDACYGGFFQLTKRGRIGWWVSTRWTRSVWTRTRACSCPTGRSAPGPQGQRARRRAH